MPNPFWHEPPTVELLQWLSRGALKHKLPQAVRLWVWLHFLYGEAETHFNLPDPFTYANWRDAFFSHTHTKGEEKPALHDRKCHCAKTTAAWLFGFDLNTTQSEWSAQLANPNHCQQLQQQFEQFEQSLKQHHVLPDNFKQLLHVTHLFGLTRRALYADLQILADMQWLKRSNRQFYRVKEWPAQPLPSTIRKTESLLIAHNLEFFTQPDLAAIADNLSQRLHGQQRFFIHVEYIVPFSQLDRVDEWQEQLRALWQHSVPPILLTYQNAKLKTVLQAVVYPVCIYYYQRGPYLCAFGQIPEGEFDRTDWRNYRLDRIQQLIPLTWEDERVPPTLKKRYLINTLPIPDDIQAQMQLAWGFDYYQPIELLLIRFDREWNERYIHDTLRHATFKPVKYQQVGRLIRQTTKGEQQQALLKLWRDRSPDDAYYQAQSRQGDPNVMQRLRAWRPRVEIFLPWSLRQQAALEVERERQLYYD